MFPSQVQVDPGLPLDRKDSFQWHLRTPIAVLCIDLTDLGITQLRFLEKEATVAARPLSSGPNFPWWVQFRAALQGYFAGEKVSFANVPVVLSGLPAFTRQVLISCQQIPYGRTLSYAQLAAQMGKPGAARAVGTAMRKNPVPVVIPCHRIVSHDGSLGGYSAPGGLETKRYLLRMEGHEM